MNTREDKFSSAMMRTPPSGIRKFFEMLIGHDDVISLSVGEPDFPTPWCIREEAFCPFFFSLIKCCKNV